MKNGQWTMDKLVAFPNSVVISCVPNSMSHTTRRHNTGQIEIGKFNLLNINFTFVEFALKKTHFLTVEVYRCDRGQNVYLIGTVIFITSYSEFSGQHSNVVDQTFTFKPPCKSTQAKSSCEK